MIQEKHLLRTEMRRLRRDFQKRKELDNCIAESFLCSEIYKGADQILLYASINSEADTYLIFEQARKDGKFVFFPRCVPDTNIIQFYRADTISELHNDAFGIPAPLASEEKAFENSEQDRVVCVVPGLAFSETGKRLGYGRGYYDTFLAKFNICTVGFCYGFQVIPNVPTESHDRRIDYLCTEKGLIPCKF